VLDSEFLKWDGGVTHIAGRPTGCF